MLQRIRMAARWLTLAGTGGLAVLATAEGQLYGTFGPFQYFDDGSEITITQVAGNVYGSLSVPSSISGKPVVRIYPEAFRYGDDITSLSLPSSLREIWSDAFSGCVRITSLTIPSGVRQIDPDAFRGCERLASFSVSSSNSYFSSSSGILYSKARGTLVRYPPAKSGPFTFPVSVARVVDGAFDGCSELSSVTVPASVTDLGEAPFGFCGTLASIEVSPANSVYASVDGMLYTKDLATLLRCPGGKSGTLELPAGLAIGDRALQGLEGIGTLTLPPDLTEIPAGMFQGSRGLTGLTIPASVTAIGDRAFSGCSGLESIEIPAGVTELPGFCFDHCTGLRTVGLPETLATIRHGAFFHCYALESIDIPDSVEIIENSVFYVCKGLRRVRLPSGLSEIGESWFYNCGQLEDIVLPDGIVAIRERAFDHCLALEDIELPESLEVLEKAAFYFSGLRRVRIPAAVRQIDLNAFSSCHNLEAIVVDPANSHFTSLNGILYSKDLGVLVQCPAGKAGRVTVPESVTEVLQNAFTHCDEVLSLRFMGDAPAWGSSGFASFEVRYFEGSAGFGGDIWKGYPAVNDGSPTGFGLWLVDHGRTYDLETTAPLGGVEALAVYGLGLDPDANPAAGLPRPVLEGDTLSIRYFAGRDGIDYRPERLDEHGHWTNAGVEVGPADAQGFRTARIPASGPSGLLRLRLERR